MNRFPDPPRLPEKRSEKTKPFPMTRKLLFSALLLWTVSPARCGLPESLCRTLDSMICKGIEDKAFPGASLAIGDKNGILYARQYGTHDYSGRQPVTDADLFDLASCTKVLSTTFVAMRLYDEGKIHVLDPLGKYLPELADTPIGDVSLRELLTHTSGMPPQVLYTPLIRNAEGGRLFSTKKSENYPYQVGDNYYVARRVAFDTLLLSRTRREGWREGAAQLFVNPAVDTLLLRQIIEAYKPSRRGTYSYSDSNFLLLKMIEERVTGKSLDSLTRRLFDELECENTCYNPLQYRDKAHCMPTETDYILGRRTVQGYVHDELAALMGGVGGNAGLFSTAEDIARFCEMMLDGGRYGNKRIITPKTVELFVSSPYEEQGVWRGYGFDKRNPETDPLGGRRCFGHTGFTGTIFWIDADAGVYMVLLTNAVHPTRLNNKLSSSRLRTRIWETIESYCPLAVLSRSGEKDDCD